MARTAFDPYIMPSIKFHIENATAAADKSLAFDQLSARLPFVLALMWKDVHDQLDALRKYVATCRASEMMQTNAKYARLVEYIDEQVKLADGLIAEFALR